MPAKVFISILITSGMEQPIFRAKKRESMILAAKTAPPILQWNSPASSFYFLGLPE